MYQAYEKGMGKIGKDKTVLSFDKIDDSIKQAEKYASFEGKVTNLEIMDKIQKANQLVQDWKLSDPSKFHTPQGLDELKKSVGLILESIPYNESTARKAIGGIYNGIKSSVSEQAPQYSKVMKDYSEAAGLIDDLTKALSLGPKSSDYTKLNRLQSIMRNNVNANYGYRKEMADKLIQEGGKDILPALAGQSLNSWTPRGLIGQGIEAATGLSALTNPAKAAVLLPSLATTSPRLMGEAFLKAGQVSRPVINLANSIMPTQEQKNLAKILMARQLTPTGE